MDWALAQNDLGDSLPGQNNNMQLTAAGIAQREHIALTADAGGEKVKAFGEKVCLSLGGKKETTPWGDKYYL